MITRDDCLRRDTTDPLASMRDHFAMGQADRDGLIYLDGNSLGPLPKHATIHLMQVMEEEWGRGLIRSWNSAGWIDLPQRIGDKIATLVGAGAGELIVADSTSINVFKALAAAIAVALPGRTRIISERTNFPTDLYIADTIARERGMELALVDGSEIAAHLDDSVAILLLTHVNYRTGSMHAMKEVTRAAHQAGAIVIWDLSHSTGAVPVDLHDAGADLAVGCGYKYLNGGPGAPAFIWVNPHHLARLERDAWRQPLAGWLGHAQPFAFTPEYTPAAGIRRFLCGTPPVLSMAALDFGVDTVLAASKFGGLTAIHHKSIELTELFMDLIDERRALGFTIVTPREADKRGSQVSISHAGDGYAITQALIARGVIGDFRAPDLVRFGFTPLYTRFADVWDAVDRLSQVMANEEWKDAKFATRAAVT